MTLPLGTTTNTLLTSNFLTLAASTPLVTNLTNVPDATATTSSLTDDTAHTIDPATTPLIEASLSAASTVFSEPPVAQPDAIDDVRDAVESAARQNPRGSLALLAALATVTTLAIPGTAYAQDLVAEAGASSTYDPETHLIVLAILFAIPIFRGSWQALRETYLFFKETFGPSPESTKPQTTGPPTTEAGGPVDPPKRPEYAYPEPFETFNQITGRIDRVISSVRDISIPLIFQKDLHLPLIAGASFYFSGGFDRPLWAYSIDVAALGLTYLNRWHRIRRVDAKVIELVQEQPLTAEAFKRHLERPMGVFGPPVPSSDQLSDDELFKLNTKLFDGEPTRSRLRSFFALKDIVQAAFLLVTQINDRSGSQKVLTELWRYALRSEIVQADPEHLPAAHAIARQWAIQSSARMRANLSFEGVEKLASIPEGAPVIMIGNHDSSMWPSFWASFLMKLADGRDIHGRPIADLHNFALARWMRNSLLAVLGIALQKLGLIYVPRREKAKKRKLWKRIAFDWNPAWITIKGVAGAIGWGLRRIGLVKDTKHDWAKDLVDKAKLGIYPLGYPSGGREPACYNEAGQVIQSSPLSNVISIRRPYLFIANGIAQQAATIAQDSNKTVYVPYIYTNGAYRVAHKQKKSFGAFIEPITTDQDVSYSVHSIQQVKPGDTTDEVATRWEQVSITATNTESALQEQVRAWLTDYRPTDGDELYDKFVSRATAELAARSSSVDAALKNYPIHYLIAARITAIHPNLARNHRRILQSRLFKLLNDELDESHTETIISRLNGDTLEQLVLTLTDEALQSQLDDDSRKRLRTWLGWMNNQETRDDLLADESHQSLREMIQLLSRAARQRFELLILLREISIRVKEFEYKEGA